MKGSLVVFIETMAPDKPIQNASALGEGLAMQSRCATNAGLYLVATPIGNLEDISLRALRVLRDADCILAEDTRHSRKLLSFFGLSTQLYSFHEHNEHSRGTQVLSPI